MTEILIEECPFCKEKTIHIMHKESSFSAQRTRCRSGRSTQYTKNLEKNEILSGCSNCGKSKKEIEKVLKHGKEPTNEEVIKRMKEAGLDPSKLK